MSSSIASVEEYWSSQTAEILPSLDLKYGAAGRKAANLARDVGNELPREGPCRWHLCGGFRCGNQRLDTLDRLLDKCRVCTSELKGAEALGGVKIFRHIQEELVEQSVLL